MDYCKACSTGFAGLGAFDAHRTGAYDVPRGAPGSRRCLTEAEMIEATKKDGSLVFERRKAGVFGLVITEDQRISLERLRRTP